jgi:hypothetical protein
MAARSYFFVFFTQNYKNRHLRLAAIGCKWNAITGLPPVYDFCLPFSAILYKIYPWKKLFLLF